MTELLDANNDRELRPGDVLMVSRKLRDKKTSKPFDWKFFMVVTQADWDDGVEGMVVGTTNEMLKDQPLKLSLSSPKNAVHYLDQSEWPDGIHAFRMALIMKRKVEID